MRLLHSHRRRRNAPCRTPGCNLGPALVEQRLRLTIVRSVGPVLTSIRLEAKTGQRLLSLALSSRLKRMRGRRLFLADELHGLTTLLLRGRSSFPSNARNLDMAVID